MLQAKKIKSHLVSLDVMAALLVSLTIATFQLTSSLNCGTNSNNTFPRIGYLGMGYDLVYGNPHALGSNDPGFRQNVFDTSNYSLGHTSSDIQYCLPNGVDAEPCNSCSLDWSYQSISGISLHLCHITSYILFGST